MYRFTLIICLLLIGLLTADDYWLPLNSPTTKTLRKIHFLDNQTGWAAGDSGVIVHTTDGGDTWTQQNSTVQSDIADIFFLNADRGWALSWDLLQPPYRTTLLSTSNGGTTWTSQLYPVENIIFRTILFLDSLNGWMGGLGGALVKTTDGGSTWNQAHIDSSFMAFAPIISLNFFSPKYAFATGGRFDLAGVIWRTTDYGQNWQAQVVGPEPIQAIHLFDSLNVLGVGGDFEYGSGVVRSSDGGQTWQYTSLTVFGIASALSFRTAAEGWAPLGGAGKFIYTPDSGTTWIDVPSPESVAVYDLVFTDSLTGYAAGKDGSLLRFNSLLVCRPVLLSPANGAQNIPTAPILSWQPLTGAENYHLQVSEQPDFSTLVVDENRIIPTQFAVSGLAGNQTYYWRVQASNSGGSSRWSEVWHFTTHPVVGLLRRDGAVSRRLSLEPNFPNPFNPLTHIRFYLPRGGEVRLEILDVRGARAALLISGPLPAGEHSVVWDARHRAGGVYFCRLQTENQLLTRKMILMK